MEYRSASAILNKHSRRKWYDLFASEYAELDLDLMNYGYAELDGGAARLLLSDAEEKFRYPIQLYHHVVSSVELQGKRVLEVGCGRGGGLSYLGRANQPRLIAGVDYSSQAIRLFRKNHPQPHLLSAVSDAERLPFQDDFFDAVVNVESSHCYESMDAFLLSVRRVLRPGGHLLLADFRGLMELDEMRQSMFRCGLEMISETIITPNVLRSMEIELERKRSWSVSRMPPDVHELFQEFIAGEGTWMYRLLMNGEAKYLSYVLRK